MNPKTAAEIIQWQDRYLAELGKNKRLVDAINFSLQDESMGADISAILRNARTCIFERARISAQELAEPTIGALASEGTRK